MKKIIDGKLYNTETAKKIASYWNGYPRGDFKYVSKVLYQKKTGEYFLYAKGGPMTEYAEPVWGGMTYGEVIIPYTEEEAKDWAVRHLDADEYMKLFGEVEE